MSATSASRRIPSGIVRRRPGRPETRFGVSAGVAKAAACRVAPALLPAPEEDERRHGDERDQHERLAEAHRRAPEERRERAQPVTGRREHRVRHGERREDARDAAPLLLRPRRRSARAATRLRVSTRTWRPVSGSTSQRSPTSGSSCSRGSRISTARTSWRLISCSSGLRQSSGPRKSETITTTPRCRAIAAVREHRGAERRRSDLALLRLALQRRRAGRAARRGPGAAAASPASSRRT